MRKATPTMRDVARLAEVSVATVSAVINASAPVSPKRTERVRRAMEALDYHADEIARSLKTGRSQVIGMILPDVTNPFYPEVIVGAQEIARAAGYSLILSNANEDPEEEKRQLDALMSRRVDGVLIACSGPAISFERLLRRHFPVVCFDRIPAGFGGDCASTDNFAGAFEATRHLIDLGHKRIAVLAGHPDLSTHRNRIDGYREAMKKANLPILDEHFHPGGMQINAGYEFGLRILALSDRPTAVFCTSNKILLGFVRAIGKFGVRCPEEISIVGFDDFAWTQNFHPQLTTVAQPSRDLGREAMRLLLDRVENKKEDAQPRQIVLKPELRVRESTRMVGAPGDSFPSIPSAERGASKASN